MRRNIILGLFVLCFSFGSAGASAPPLATPQDPHVPWVFESLLRMETIKPGMTRRELLTVFAPEGGISGPTRRTYGYRECSMFKVDVEFEIVGRPARDADGRGTMVESLDDRILTISTPYIARVIVDG